MQGKQAKAEDLIGHEEMPDVRPRKPAAGAAVGAPAPTAESRRAGGGANVTRAADFGGSTVTDRSLRFSIEPVIPNSLSSRLFLDCGCVEAAVILFGSLPALIREGGVIGKGEPPKI